MQVNITLYVNQLSKSIDSESDAFQINIFAAINFLILLFCGLVLGCCLLLRQILYANKPRCWDYRYAPPILVSFMNNFSKPSQNNENDSLSPFIPIHHI